MRGRTEPIRCFSPMQRTCYSSLVTSGFELSYLVLVFGFELKVLKTFARSNYTVPMVRVRAKGVQLSPSHTQPHETTGVGACTPNGLASFLRSRAVA